MTLAGFLRCSVAAIALAAPGVQAAQSGVYLLQLGSFEKKEAAQERWEGLRSKYPNLLEGLSVRYMDVTLPPDNFTVFRTQAGALTSRANAQSICDRLTAKGDECYVVETAMFAPGDISAPVPVASASLTSPGAAPEAALVPAAPAVAEAPRAPMEEPPVLKPLAPGSAPQAEPMASSKETPEAPRVAPGLATPSAGDAMMEVASRQQQSAPTPTSPEVQPKPAPVKAVEDEDGFWSFVSALDPFSDDAPKKQKKAVPQEMPQAEPQITAPAPVPPAPADTIELDANMQQQAQFSDPFPIMAPPPPPPAGMAAPSMAAQEPSRPPVALMGQQTPAPQTPAPQEPMAAPMPPAQAMPQASYDLPPPPASVGQVENAFAHPVADTSPQSGSAGDVRVSEAVRVPLTQGQALPPTTLESERARVATPPMAMGTPSQQVPGFKTVWAQIGYFADQQHALAYWDMFRKANPSFPPVRVRITSPYMSTASGAPKISLRVGPFDKAAFVADICDEVVTSSKDSDYPLDCKSVTDMNESVAPRMARATPEETRRDAMFAAQPAAATEMYWVQLGSFRTPAEADGYYRQLAAAHKPTLDGLAPGIAPPIMSSSMEPVFRLRMGPFPLRSPADTLCAKLQSKGSQCLIVFSK